MMKITYEFNHVMMLQHVCVPANAVKLLKIAIFHHIAPIPKIAPGDQLQID